MATAYVRRLPKIPTNTLPRDATCPICAQPYENQTTDSGSFEKAVCLPCNGNHIFGSECISEWLTYGKSCPLCRHEIPFIMGNIVIEQNNPQRASSTFHTQRSQEWGEYWYATFWILHQRGDRAVETKWHEWYEDWIAAAGRWDESCEAHARAALSHSPLTPSTVLEDAVQVRITAAGLQTLRFREYRLYQRFQADAGECPELNAPPRFQLTPAQENELFCELERRHVFMSPPLPLHLSRLSKREYWNLLRDAGFVWDPDWEVFWRSGRGRWSRYWL